jgi:hypothetical protein
VESVLSCPVLSCPVLSCLVLSCPVLHCSPVCIIILFLQTTHTHPHARADKQAATASGGIGMYIPSQLVRAPLFRSMYIYHLIPSRQIAATSGGAGRHGMVCPASSSMNRTGAVLRWTFLSQLPPCHMAAAVQDLCNSPSQIMTDSGRDGKICWASALWFSP